jgi:hypothetical protein
MNIKVLENFITFLTRGRTQGFDSERRSYDQLKLIELTIYDFLIRVDFKFLSILTFIGLHGFQSPSYPCTCICKIMTKAGLIRSSPKEKFIKYIRRMSSQWQIALIPVVSSNKTILHNRG